MHPVVILGGVFLQVSSILCNRFNNFVLFVLFVCSLMLSRCGSTKIHKDPKDSGGSMRIHEIAAFPTFEVQALRALVMFACATWEEADEDVFPVIATLWHIVKILFLLLRGCTLEPGCLCLSKLSPDSVLKIVKVYRSKEVRVQANLQGLNKL